MTGTPDASLGVDIEKLAETASNFVPSTEIVVLEGCAIFVLL